MGDALGWGLTSSKKICSSFLDANMEADTISFLTIKVSSFRVDHHWFLDTGNEEQCENFEKLPAALCELLARVTTSLISSKTSLALNNSSM